MTLLKNVLGVPLAKSGNIAPFSEFKENKSENRIGIISNLKKLYTFHSAELFKLNR